MMKSLTTKAAVAAVATATALTLGSTAEAASISTGGVWTTATPNGAISGVGTNTISWGTPAESGGQKSSYVFAGRSTFTAPTDGTKFSLGEFTHNNFPITGTTLSEANLEVSLTGDISKVFNFVFKHIETPNNANPCAEGGDQPCPDRVFLPSLFSQETVNIGGQDLFLKISGFEVDGVTTQSFLTKENQANTAFLVGQFTPVPTPALLPGLIGMGIAALRKRNGEADETEA
ncbi:MAG: THxN family PEP-CTERM protein [Spirulina sp.]